MKFLGWFFCLAVTILSWSLTLNVVAQPANTGQPIRIEGTVQGIKLIPIAITGYSGEVDKVLKFDLEVAGFKITEASAAQYLLTGKNDGSQVEARLIDNFNKANLLGKAYNGGTARTQPHTLADEVVALVMKNQGIARTKIAFKVENGKKSEVYIADYDGANPVQVTSDNSRVAAPAWVPGKWMLYYTSYKSGYTDIYAHNLATGERRIVAQHPGLNSSAAISNDGKRMAMILSKDRNPELYVADANGSNLLRLTKTKEDESSPCWSPDGSKICFAAKINERRALYVVPSTGGPMTRIRTDGAINPSEPDWSPDGKQIIFTSQTRAGFSIWIVPAEGGSAELLTEGEDPSWAPNSRTVIFTRRKGDTRTLSLLDVPTKHVKDTAQISGSRSQPSWAK
ncbi:MAG: hypothetical protein ACO1QB_03640 [Verrucomicrobiales bacterium]